MKVLDIIKEVREGKSPEAEISRRVIAVISGIDVRERNSEKDEKK